ncbi:MAG: hypothetical protein VW472_04395 [Candidatus Puniceispirillum sp.]
MLRDFGYKVVSHWFTAIFVAYVALWSIQYFLIFPLEAQALGQTAALVSMIYLPHAVRVLAAWMIGPKSIFALLPASFVTYLALYDGTGSPGLSDFAVPIIGALCAPVALELMRIVKINVYPQEVGIISWRTLVFAGFLSSILNSFFQTLALDGKFPIEATFDILTRFVVGDVAGLVVVLFLFVGLMKFVRGKSNV